MGLLTNASWNLVYMPSRNCSMDLNLWHFKNCTMDLSLCMDWKIGFYRRYIGYQATSKWNSTPTIEEEEYRRYIGLEPINQQKNLVWSDVRSNEESLSKYRRYIDNISGKYRRFFWKFFFKYLSFFIF